MFVIKDQTDILENQFIPHHLAIWYDRHSRNWIVQVKDIYENQVGDALYSYDKQTAIKNKEQLMKKYDIE